MKVGTIIKLSKEGLDWLYKYATPKQLERGRALRYEYRGESKKDPGVIIAKRLTSQSYVRYHWSFVEPAEKEKREIGGVIILIPCDNRNWELWMNLNDWALPLSIYFDPTGYKALTLHFLCFVLAFDW